MYKSPSLVTLVFIITYFSSFFTASNELLINSYNKRKILILMTFFGVVLNSNSAISPVDSRRIKLLKKNKLFEHIRKCVLYHLFKNLSSFYCFLPAFI